MKFDLQTAELVLPSLVVGLTIHEFAHAWTASLLGDNLARRWGRMSLNPFRHLTPLGTLAILFLPFGWGRPVPVNLYNFRRPKWDYLLSSLAGPAANVVIAALILPLTYLSRHTLAFGEGWEGPMVLLHSFLHYAFLLNVAVATFNLLPIPPLDGSKIWPVLIPPLKTALEGRKTFVFMAVIFALLWTGALYPVFDAVLNPAERLLPRSDDAVIAANMEQSRKEFDAGKYKQALRSVDAVLKIDPASVRAMRWRALALGDQDKWTAALKEINKVLKLPAAGQVWSKDYEYRAWILDGLHRPDEAAADRATAELLRGLPKGGDLSAARKANAKVTEALGMKWRKIDLDGMALADACQQFVDAKEVPIEVDWKALAKLGVTPQSPVTVYAARESIRDDLREILESVSPKDHTITYSVADGRVYIPARVGRGASTRAGETAKSS